MSANVDFDNFQRLGLAVVWQAIMDLEDPDPVIAADAAGFLSREAWNWLDSLGVELDYKRWQAWVRQGCPYKHGPSMHRIVPRKPKALKNPEIAGVRYGKMERET